ncbi:disease resistance protein Pik-2-like [Oryza glaberrima]|uniref:disease resistance protein Pik-2-like n=1 Tax=Oryza glaberrima TaxID=4538 RepID=UPI00224C3594|nr:disease resistance protein Pik-2-like [Oryza glaberrima]
MEATALSVGKSVVSGALGYAKSAFAEEVALQLGIQRDHAFIRDELHMMQAFLMAAHDERDEHKVVKAWVQQVRDVAYDVEDCLQDLAVRVGKPSWWRKCSPSMLLERRSVAKKMKELRAKVEDVSQRSNRYRLINGSGSKASTDGVQSRIAGATTMSESEETRRQQDKAKVDLLQLINSSDDNLRVIAVWGTSGVNEDTSIIKRAYDDLRIGKKFECCAWMKLMSPLNQTEFLHNIIRQFYVNSLQQSAEAKQEAADLVDQIPHKMAKVDEVALVNKFKRYVNQKSCLIVVPTGVSTIEEWDMIKRCFPRENTRSRIVVCTEHVEVARMCVWRDSIPPEYKNLSETLYAFYQKGSQDGTLLVEPSSSSNITTTNGNNNLTANKKLGRIETMIATLEESQLIGRTKEKSDIIKLIKNQASQQSQVISIWGMGGLGKTALVQDIYRSQDVSNIFDKHACVTILRPFNSGQVIHSLAKQFTDENENGKERDLSKLLEGKRYLVVLDDIWDTKEWDDIVAHLPNKAGSCIIDTTREENIAKHCSKERSNAHIYKLSGLENDQALQLFNKKVFKGKTNLDEQYPDLVEQANLILKKCNGLPLAIVTIGGFLANQPKAALAWRKINEHISAELEMNPEIKTIRTVLLKSYDGLPYNLKSCFLYLSIFPEDHKVSRKRLMQRWTAEGYTTEARGKSPIEIAHDNFTGLISRSMTLPVAQESIKPERGINYCRLHDLMREISITKSMEENLVFRLENGYNSKTHGTTRHLSISSNWEGDKHEFESIVDMSRVRSLTVFGRWKPFFISEKMTMLRVLDLEDTKGLVNHHLEHIGNLLHLKYLSLRRCDDIWQLPSSLGDLKQLELLDIRSTKIFMLPKTFIKLQKLKYLHAGGINSVEQKNDEPIPTLPRGSRKLKGLHTLRDVHLAWGNTVIQEIERLTQLCKLGVVGINKKNGPSFCSAISKLSQLESLSVCGDRNQDLRGCLDHGTSSSTSLPPENLQSLKLEGKLGELPQWIGKLHNLVKLRLLDTRLEDVDATIKVLEALPSLAILRLSWNSFNHDVVHLNFHREQQEATAVVLFPSLRVLQLRGIGDGLKSVQFGGGATPKLELLQFSHSPGPCGVGFMSGLKELKSLREFMLSDRQYRDDFVKDVEEQLANHPNPNKPLLKRFSVYN